MKNISIEWAMLPVYLIMAVIAFLMKVTESARREVREESPPPRNRGRS